MEIFGKTIVRQNKLECYHQTKGFIRGIQSIYLKIMVSGTHKEI